ncbi:maltose/maltodextrin ABC transporter substrate-binding protein MalE [Caldimonas caldifontis]|uniref:Maltodextrin-binding protein n=1 Tax=Caldimonas caldifontis TaxID=1452508 RepID=A0A2S5STG2_9BURK|nr:maltose/maltodextrin ABC transporter substrate-binding protein MalE [Caldimonas caldifontis]PPE66003.1 maltose/maltodextrin ABC transporter substrate-binding protein MalE [Caldimonas caldifontis]
MNIQRQRIKLVAAAATLALSAGFAGSAYAVEPGKLLIWINGDKGYNGLQKVGDEFEKKTGVKVTVEHPEDAPGKFQQAAAAGKGPDIWIWAHDRVGEWIQGGLLQPVTPSKKIVDDIDPLAWKAFNIGGRTWGYPISIEAVALIYNKDLVPTPPKSFEEVIALDKKLSAQGKKAILWDYNNTYFTWPLLAANGGYAFKQKADGTYDPNDTGVNNAGALKGAELIATMIKDGVMPKGAGYADMEAAVNQGKVAMMINGPWAWDNLKKSKINFGVAKIPTVAGKKAAPFVGVMGAMVNKSSPNRDIAVEFIENHMLSVAGLKAINDDVPLGTPASKAFFNQLKSDPHIQATMASAQDGAPMPNIPEMGRFWSSMASALQNMTEGRQTPKEALDAAAKRISAK